jgi:hypothetical protein
MSLNKGFLQSIKETQPQLWQTIEKTSKDGLIIIDEENDAITATNRLLWTYPDLHETISVLINQWSERELKENSEDIFKNLISNLKESN